MVSRIVIADALLSFDKMLNTFTLVIHKVTPCLTIVTTAVTIYLLFKIRH